MHLEELHFRHICGSFIKQNQIKVTASGQNQEKGMCAHVVNVDVILRQT